MSADPYTIREWRPEDAGAIAAIYNQSVVAGNATMEETEKTPETTLALLRALGERETVLVIEKAGGPVVGPVVGWGILKRYSEREGYRFTAETSVYLDANEIGHGLGTRMKLALIERCRQWGYHHLVAKIFADNEASIRYNLKLGYEMVGIQREVGFKKGAWQDVAILQLILSSGVSDEPRDREGDER